MTRPLTAQRPRRDRGDAGHGTHRHNPERRRTLPRHLGLAMYALAMVALVVAVDVAFFRGHFWPRLTVNVGIVLVFLASYLRFLRKA